MNWTSRSRSFGHGGYCVTRNLSIVDSLKGSLGVTSGPATFIQSKERVNCAAMPPARSFYRLHWDGEDLYPNLNTPNRSTKKKSNWYHF